MAAQLDTLAWARRARALAEANGTAVVWFDRGGYWMAQSSTSNTVYAIRTGLSALPQCDCPAGQHGRPCKHAGAVLIEQSDEPRYGYDENPSETAGAWA